MEKQRYTESGENSFYGLYRYDQIGPEKNFLRMLNEIIDWKRYTRKLKGSEVGGVANFYAGVPDYAHLPPNSPEAGKAE